MTKRELKRRKKELKSLLRRRRKLAQKWDKMAKDAIRVNEAITEMNNYIDCFNRAHVIKDSVRHKIQ